MSHEAAAARNGGFLGRWLLAHGRDAEAYDALLRHMQAQPDAAHLCYYAGVAALRLGHYGPAADYLYRATELEPTHAPSWAHLGRVYHHEERLSEAIACYDRCLAIRPDQSDVLVLAGNAAWEMGDTRAASGYYVRASACPNTPEGDYNLSRIYLQHGDYGLGFRLHEQRLKCAHYLGAQGQGRPWYGTALQWQGQPYSGTLLIHGEQGNGDILQMLRFVPWACERAGHVVLEVPASMVTLCCEAFPTVTVVARGDELPSWDTYCPTMSLPYVYGVQVPGDVPSPTLGTLAPWVRSAFGGHNVGICWKGSPDHPRDKHRSTTAATLYAMIGDTRHPENVFALDPAVSPELRDYLSTVTAMRHLGLVITVDTSVAHLAGALGCPTFLLLDHFPDWRWGLEATTTPWYPSVRIFRQPAPGDWASVITEVRAALEVML